MLKLSEQKLSDLNSSLYQEFLNRKESIALECFVHPEERGEGYVIYESRRGLKVEAESQLGLTYALGFLVRAKRPLGKNSPRFPLRILFPKKGLPEKSRAFALGYNRVVGVDIAKAAAVPLSPKDKRFPIALKDEIAKWAGFDSIYYESAFDPCHKDALYQDLALEELFLLEKFKNEGQQLIYHVKGKVSYERLKIESDKDTLLVGHDLLHTKGLGGRGEGLWPIIAADEWRGFSSRTKGMIVECLTMPAGQGFLEANIWAFGHALLRNENFLSLIEEWFESERPELKVPPEIRDLITSVSQNIASLAEVNDEISREKFSGDKGRALAGKVVADLAYIEENIKETRFYDYFVYFSRDARRYVAHFLQCCNLNLPNVLREGDYGESFFTEALYQGGGGLRTSAKVTFKEKVLVSDMDGQRLKIFRENLLS